MTSKDPNATIIQIPQEPSLLLLDCAFCVDAYSSRTASSFPCLHNSYSNRLTNGQNLVADTITNVASLASSCNSIQLIDLFFVDRESLILQRVCFSVTQTVFLDFRMIGCTLTRSASCEIAARPKS